MDAPLDAAPPPPRTAPTGAMSGQRPWGLVLAVLVSGLWALTLGSSLVRPFAAMSAVEVALRLGLQTWLYTGLFITAHDAMHGTVAPGRPRLNDAVGTVAVGLYALFPYATLKSEHRLHHQHPAAPGDPDWHGGTHTGFVRWYLRFVGHYVRWAQVVGMAVVFNVLAHALGVGEANLIVLWVLPSLLSTVQLFYFGTYLPHREAGAPFRDHHRARSNDYGAFTSLVSCFHFGYHWEHHARPGVPWWALPAARRSLRAR